MQIQVKMNGYLFLSFYCLLLFVVLDAFWKIQNCSQHGCMSSLNCLAACSGFVYVCTINSIYFYNFCRFIAEFSTKMVVIMLLSFSLFAMYLLWKHLTFKRLNTPKGKVKKEGWVQSDPSEPWPVAPWHVC